MRHELTTTREPDLLVPGSLEALHTDADALDATAQSIADAAQDIGRQVVPGWLGDASAGWSERRVVIGESLSTVVAVLGVAAQALRAHAEVLTWARGRAGLAVDVWAREQQLLVCPAGSLAGGVGTVLGSGPGVGAGVALAPGPGLPGTEETQTGSVAQQVLAFARERVRASEQAVADVLDRLSEGLPDGRWHHDQWFGALGEWVVSIMPVVQVVRTAVDFDGVAAEQEAQGDAIRAAFSAISTDPDQAVPILFDTQTLEDNPARWWGAAAPGIVATAAGGVGAASRAVSVLRAPKPVRTFTSPDPHVAEIADYIERQRPGWIGRVNFTVNHPNTGYREIDIEVGNVFVQVKSGPAGGLTGQLARTEVMTGRTAIGYAPDMPHAAYANALRQGVPIARTPEELMDVLRELQ